ncbi:hypothetical protein [Catenulispora subtropica]|uniref:Uncharacterized protein n=1 Tax=Catenulispora subtropica TaxID=450798 RepID=A0ABN2S9G0_9ACTN
MGHNVDLCGAFSAADMSRTVGETFLTCTQVMTTDPLTPGIHQTVATYTEADDLRIFTLSYITNFTATLQKWPSQDKITGIGDTAWFNEPAFKLQVAYGPDVIEAMAGRRDMGGGDVLAVDKKVVNAAVGRLGTGG